ncbi:MAG: flap endonuclease [Candidatus Dormibacteraeota bacterium]|uniref:5'-3' exonuclease n=1 Tax=Candidatus Amunia macphersoniae TaxID=3127014 RepID=A0A934KHG5_9BACT|nr:flap endonuclease [Candidatus Dormibacteraeota bacterium]
MSCEWLFVDGSSLIFRAFHGVPATVRSPDGRQINAVRGFLETLTRLIHSRRPHGLAVASDEDWRPAWRVELIPSYKAHRTAEPIPPDLEPQMPVIHELLDAIGVDFIGAPQHEAEDVIATWAARAHGTVEIVSGDRDLFALVEDPRVVVLYPEKGGMAVVDEAEVTRRYGIPGRRYAEYAVLRGDPSDGLPGLKGVGSVTAAALVRSHATQTALLQHGRFSADQRAYLDRALRVTRPVADLPIAVPTGGVRVYPRDHETLSRLANQNGLEAPCDRLVQALTSVVKGGGN